MGVGREMGGCGQCIKYSMFLANFFIFLGGAVALGIGVWTLLDKAFVTQLTGTTMFLGAVYILIGTGGLVTLIAFMGCVGAVKEVKCMLLTYFLIVFIVFVTMLVGGVLGYVFREDVRKNTEYKMRSTLVDYRTKDYIRAAWDKTQETLHCCGVDGPSDWKAQVPESCCKMGPAGKPGALECDKYKEGCLHEAVKTARDHAAFIGTAGVIVACIMLLGMIFSCILFKMI
ncbi:tetraspanin-18 [Thrips palmi]|uniref:Tetraspanin n=1 Tax=Thrips palmi TaxID=161013 RepID=A0A6P8Z2L6_THRPL|nr:tetraspanin-18 [Thrips palmi]XP_034246734.1 tetraspanin-18 [Thrips palmi]XP_034246736.1 tetraspanin-18 [Thrips palmi]